RARRGDIAREMHRQACNDAVDPRARGRGDLHRLCRIQLIEHRSEAVLRQSLNSKVAVVGHSADDEARLVDSRDEQAARGAASERYDDVANIVHLRMKFRELRTDSIA